MADTICIFEDPKFTQLLPLVYTRPVYDLRCGIFTLREKIEHAYPKATIALLCRPYLAGVVRQQNPTLQVNEVHAGNCLLLNGRVLADAQLAKRIPLKGHPAVFLSANTVVAVRLNAGRGHSLRHELSETFDAEHFAELEKIQLDVPLINYPWDLVGNNGAQIGLDFQYVKRNSGRLRGKIYPGVHLLNRKNIIVGQGAVVKPGVVLDAENGPIVIGKNAKIFPNAVVEGPAFIGAGSMIKIGAKIYEDTSIGEMCKVGGEVETSIIHAYSNKQHDGFLGHAYLGMWCNLGADTNNSDLKNNYGSVRVVVNGKDVDSGLQFVGLTMGDHSKSGINTMFNTGTVVGVMSNVFGAGFPSKNVPSYSWGGSEGLTTYAVDKAVEVARRVMARRRVNMSEVDEELLRRIFDMTKGERS
jgi:UDP-N-acetylglucosamine diphosphorylase / glucose-1-phosphate thymidylyltransferase / UDP-N-acetylgalactosamine diphosphorylase / glucosamine-1-phosphate N-acetyltransferase / galactosamine-1-phosphate N-acetyltransferase